MKKFLLIILALAVIGALAFGGYRYYKRLHPTIPTDLITAVRGTITEEITVTGKVESKDTHALTFDRTGKIQFITVKVGDTVVAGQSLAQLDGSDLEAQIDQAKAGVELQRSKRRELEDKDDVQEHFNQQDAQIAQAIAQLRNTEAQRDKLTITAPTNGTVTKVDAKAGEIASPGKPLITVINPQSLQVAANVPEVDIGKVSLGGHTRITLDAFAGTTIIGAVTTIDPAETIIDGVVNYKITIALDAAAVQSAPTQPNMKIRSGMTANLSIETQHHENAIIIPQSTAIENDTGTFVKKFSNGREQPETPVTLGIRDTNGMVEVLSGVESGDQLINVGIKTQS